MDYTTGHQLEVRVLMKRRIHGVTDSSTEPNLPLVYFSNPVVPNLGSAEPLARRLDMERAVRLGTTALILLYLNPL